MTTPVRPNRRERAFAAALTKLQHLPAATNTYTITRDLTIPMRDGVTLLADLYSPVGPSKGTVLIRSPYGFGTFVGTMTGGAISARGYTVLLGRCRGTFGSGGVFEPFLNEVEDGADTVAWMRTQSWFDGRFAMYGASYLGFTEWAVVMDSPPELRAAVIGTAPHDFHRAIFRGGGFSLVDYLGWSRQVSDQEEPNLLKLIRGHARAQKTVPAATAELPIIEAAASLLKNRAPWFIDWASQRDPCSARAQRMNLTHAVDRVKIPVLLQGGWQDPFLPQTFEEYEHLHGRGVDVALTVGPWTHGELITKGRKMMLNESLAWFDEHLAGGPVRARHKPVRVFVTGDAEQWRDLDEWPPPTRPRTFNLLPDGGLGDAAAPAGSEARFTYDPSRPTPTVGGPVLLNGGYTDDTALAERSDVVGFTSEPMPRPVEVLGNPVVELVHATDNPNVDLFVRLSEVDADGRSRNVSDGFLRLDPTRPNGVIRIELDVIAHRFAAGNRIRLVVAGGCHPRWDRNLGTGENLATTSRTAVSNRTIDLAASALVLPTGL